MTDKIVAYDPLEPIKGYRIQKSNPAYYNKPRMTFDFVYAPSYPKIEAEFVAAGIPAFRPESAEQPEPIVEPVQAPVEAVEPVSEPEQPEPQGEPENEPEAAVEDENEEEGDWRDLSWPKLRSLAAQHSEEPIKSKDQAISVLEEAEKAGKL